MTIALYSLRCVQLGLHFADLEQLEYGDVIDMMVEATNDSVEYMPVATQDDFDKF